MPTTRRTFLGLGAAAAATVTFAACSSQGGESSGGSGGGISLWTHNGGNEDELAVVQSAVDAFNEANPDTSVDLKSFPQASYNDSIAAAAVSGDLPDILDLDGPIMPNWAWAGYLAPLTISSELEASIIDSAKGYWNDTLYSIGPYDTSLCFLGRKSAFDAAGVPVPAVDKPWTKDEFNDALSKLGQLPDYDVAVDMGVWDTAEWWPYAYAPMLQSFGGDLIDRETYRTAEGFLNGTAAVEWGTWFRSLFADGYASQTPGTDGTDFLQSSRPRRPSARTRSSFCRRSTSARARTWAAGPGSGASRRLRRTPRSPTSSSSSSCRTSTSSSTPTRSAISRRWPPPLRRPITTARANHSSPSTRSVRRTRCCVPPHRDTR